VLEAVRREKGQRVEDVAGHLARMGAAYPADLLHKAHFSLDVAAAGQRGEPREVGPFGQHGDVDQHGDLARA